MDSSVSRSWRPWSWRIDSNILNNFVKIKSHWIKNRNHLPAQTRTQKKIKPTSILHSLNKIFQPQSWRTDLYNLSLRPKPTRYRTVFFGNEINTCALLYLLDFSLAWEKIFYFFDTHHLIILRFSGLSMELIPLLGTTQKAFQFY